jgi:hypothetical protein
MFWLVLGSQVLGFAGFGLILLQGFWDLRWRREIERIEQRIEALETPSPTDPNAASEAGREILDEFKTQFARYHPVFGRAFVAGAVLLIVSYVIRIGLTLATHP